MSTQQRKELEQQLWNIADELRGKMNADEFRDYCLGFIFYKYLSESLNSYADKILEEDGVAFMDIEEGSLPAIDGSSGQEVVKFVVS